MYVVNNSPTSKSGMRNVSARTSEGRRDYDTISVNIIEPGSWWIHVYQRDRAGNETWTTSSEYKIVRIGEDNNKTGRNYNKESSKIWLELRQTNDKIPRATRFDLLMQSYGLTSYEAQDTDVHLTLPKWVDDAIEKKDASGNYIVSTGTVNTHLMNYYSKHDLGPQTFATPSTILQWWQAFIPPYGTPITLDREGNRKRSMAKFEIQLEYKNYYPSYTHPSIIQFDIVPETKIKTEIIKNEY